MAGLTPFQFSSGKRMYNVTLGKINSTNAAVSAAASAVADTIGWQEMWINPSNVKWETNYRQSQKQTAQAIVTFHFKPDYTVLTCSGKCGWFRIKSELEELRDAAIQSAIGKAAGVVSKTQVQKNKDDMFKKEALKNTAYNKQQSEYRKYAKADVANNSIIDLCRNLSVSYKEIQVDMLVPEQYSNPSVSGSSSYISISKIINNSTYTYDHNGETVNYTVFSGTNAELHSLSLKIYNSLTISEFTSAVSDLSNYINDNIHETTNVDIKDHVDLMIHIINDETKKLCPEVKTREVIILNYVLPEMYKSYISSLYDNKTVSYINESSGTSTYTMWDEQEKLLSEYISDAEKYSSAAILWNDNMIASADTLTKINILNTNIKNTLNNLKDELSFIISRSSNRLKRAKQDLQNADSEYASASANYTAAKQKYNNSKNGLSSAINNVTNSAKNAANVTDPYKFMKSGHANRLNNSPSLFLSRLKLTADEPMYYIDDNGVEHYNPKYIKMFTKQYPDGVIYEGYFSYFTISETPDYETVDYDFRFVAENKTPVTLLQRVLGMYSGYTSVAGDALNIVGA